MSEDLILEEIDRRFDPFLGGLPNGFSYEGSEAEFYDQLAADAYWQNGHDLLIIASQGQENPMTHGNWLNSDVPVDWIYNRPKSLAAGYFLRKLNISSENIVNYEPNYLKAVMDTHPRELEYAKDSYFIKLLEREGSPEAVWKWTQLTIDLAGPDIID